MNNTSWFPKALLAVYIIEFIFFAFNPYDRAVWWAENIPIILIVLSVMILYICNIRFSNAGYLCLAILPLWHTVGGHYTFELVPFDFFNNTFGFSRNMFDRIGHFSVGFYALPIAEYLLHYRKVANQKVALLFAICIIGTTASVYEIIEWGYASLYGGSAGAAFLGSQGDIWDAQKDMALDIAGSLFISIIYVLSTKLSSTTYRKSQSTS